MTNYLTIVEPFATPINALFFGLIAITIFSAVLTFLILTKRMLTKLRISGVLGMLIGFIGMVSFGAVIFTFVHSRSIRPLVFETDAIQYGDERITYKKVQSHYMKPLIQQSRYSAQISTDTAVVYVIEMKTGDSYLFSNDNYDMMNLKSAMDQYVGKK